MPTNKRKKTAISPVSKRNVLEGVSSPKTEEKDLLYVHAAYHDALIAEQEYIAWWLADMISAYIARPPSLSFWKGETEELLYNPAEPPKNYREENFYCVDPGMETENVLVDEEAGYVYKRRDQATEFTPAIWKIKAFLSKKVPYIVDMEYDPHCDIIKQRYIKGRLSRLDAILNLERRLEADGYGFIIDLGPANVIQDFDGHYHIIDFYINFGHPDWWRMTRKYRTLAKLEKQAEEEVEELYQRKEEELGYRENPNGWDNGDGNGYGMRGRFPRPMLQRWVEPYSRIEVIVEIGGTDNDFELRAAVEELGRRIGTRVELLSPETAEDEPYKSMLPLAILPNIDTTDKLAQLYFNIEATRDVEPDTFYIFDGRVYAQVFEALLYSRLTEQPDFYGYDMWPLLLSRIEERSKQRVGRYYPGYSKLGVF